MNKNLLNQRPMEATDWNISIPIKITDGLFMADHHIAQDIDFFETNQVTHVINCAGKQVNNNRNANQVSFLTFQWSENHIQNITDQSVVSVVVNFIEECRRQYGCLLIHCYQSESRPFCLLACYLMIKFKWNLFKTLEFLNSRKQDIELQPAFFQQLTNFHQKLQQKGLIKSRGWAISETMMDDEIILTNTYLNSRKKIATTNQSSNNRKKSDFKKINVSWKPDLAIEHVYCPNSIINVQVNQPKKMPPKERSESVGNKEEKDKKQKNTNNLQEKTNSLSEMNVTKKWTELREMWMKEKENHKEKQNQNLQNCENKKGVMVAKKDTQRLNDRLQQKLNLLKRYEQKQDLKKSKKTGEERQPKEMKETSIEESFKNQNPKTSSQKNSRILHNNWIINNQVIKENNQTNKPKTNKSVIIVKPNHTNIENQSRSSVRKASGSERKEERDDVKFFRNEDVGIGKGRCNSTKVQRKESPANAINMGKNTSFKSKGKWKF